MYAVCAVRGGRRCHMLNRRACNPLMRAPLSLPPHTRTHAHTRTRTPSQWFRSTLAILQSPRTPAVVQHVDGGPALPDPEADFVFTFHIANRSRAAFEVTVAVKGVLLRVYGAILHSIALFDPTNPLVPSLHPSSYPRSGTPHCLSGCCSFFSCPFCCLSS